ncbi:calcium-binding protein [Yoonia sp. 2307UL14-13]|uniref:calcium-binding protein n=1 Tax=Yoonia sp. 2307UL14-13 TaxID=3126506 RepID=UPI0030AE60B6
MAYRVAEEDQNRSRITDLTIVDVDGTPQLISATRYDGVIQSWDIGASALTLKDTLTFDGGDRAGMTPTVVMLDIDGQPGIQIGGGVAGAPQTIGIDDLGQFVTPTPLSVLPAEFRAFQKGAKVSLPDGRQVLYGAIADEPGLAKIQFSAAGAYQDHALLTATSGDITAVASVTIGSQTYLFTADATLSTISVSTVAPDGRLIGGTTLDADGGLWISAPQVMEAVEIGGITYLILGSAGSSTISVIEVGHDGALTMRDHLTDDRNSRFDGITALEIVQLDGRTYVIAGGADDGVSIFQLLEGGYLIAQDHFADTTEIGLDNISDLAAIGRNNGLDLFVSSSSEAGITQLRYDTGSTGITTTAVLSGGLLAGTTGNDILQGHNGDDQITGDDGDDILRDGAGSDTLSGGDGADLFILSADATTDRVTDFTMGEDKLDLSQWQGLRDLSQLTMTIREDGVDIVYGNELLVIQSVDGAPIDYRLWDNTDLLGTGIRLSTTITPGYPGPTRPDPDFDPPPDEPDDPGTPIDMGRNIGALGGVHLDGLRGGVDGTASSGSAEPDTIVGTPNADTIVGGAGTDLVFARDGDDIVHGGDGSDVLLGGAGTDTLNGEGDGDLIVGGRGADTLSGGAGHDTLRGGDGDDWISGGPGDDILFGDAGADTFIFEGGDDVIHDFVQGEDHVILDRALWTGLTNASDVLLIYGSYADDRVTISFDSGDILTIIGVEDYGTFANDLSLF